MSDQATDQSQTDSQISTENTDNTAEHRETASNWHDMLNDDFKSDSKIAGFETVNDMAESYKGLERMLGSRIPIPTEDAGEEKIKEFNEKIGQVPGVFQIPAPDDEVGMEEMFRKLGRPESASEYKVSRPEEMPEGLAYNEESEKWFLDVAHKIGLNNSQAQEVLGGYNQMVIDGFNQRKEQTAQAEAEIRKEWGADTDRRIAAAQKLVEAIGGEQAWQELEQSGVGNNLVMVKLLSDIGMQTLEDSVINGENNTPAETNDELNAKMGELMANPAYMDNMNPNHKAVVQKVYDIQNKLNKAQSSTFNDGGVTV